MHNLNPQHKALFNTLTIALFASALYGACVESDDVEVEQWDVRDSLGISPQWLGHSPANLNNLATRYTDTITHQSENGAWSEVPYNTEPSTARLRRKALQSLDQHRSQDQQPPLLVAWWEIDGSDLVARACPLEPSDLNPSTPPKLDEALWQNWTINRGFDRALTHHENGLDEFEALMQLMPSIQLWTERCAQSAGPDVVEDQTMASLNIERAQGAPLMLAFWPALNTITINPQLLLLWAKQNTALFASEFEQRPQSLHDGVSSFNTCVEEVRSACSFCHTSSTCQPERTNSSLSEALCLSLNTVPDGAAQYCAYRALHQNGVNTCVRNTDSSCSVPSYTSVPDEAYSDFVNDVHCLQILDRCLQSSNAPAPPQWNNDSDEYYQNNSSTCASDIDSCAGLGSACGESDDDDYDSDYDSDSDSDCGSDSDSDCGDSSDSGDSGGSDCGGDTSDSGDSGGDCGGGCEGDSVSVE